MDESAVKGLKIVEVKDSDAAIPKSCEIGRIMVRGFDRGLPHDDVESALRKHFASCGEITDVYIPLTADGTLFGYALIYFVGEGAVDMALQLNGSDVGGWNVSARALPFPNNANCSALLRVKGYDTSLSEVDIKSALDKFFSSCGKISKVLVFADAGSSLVFIDGEDVAVKAPQLSGSYMGGRQLAVERPSPLEKSTVHNRPRRVLTYGGPNCCESAKLLAQTQITEVGCSKIQKPSSKPKQLHSTTVTKEIRIALGSCNSCALRTVKDANPILLHNRFVSLGASC